MLFVFSRAPQALQSTRPLIPAHITSQVCFVGHIVVATAKSTNQIIAGLTISGFGGANCQVWTSTCGKRKEVLDCAI